MVDVAPYGGVFPLTAIINKANHNVQNVKVTVLGKGEKRYPDQL
ncbi:arylsulfotransferase [Salmonella enterica subsp. enterica]|nr:arylsulfotransferase [Salmonella enterica subsp. enterica] [Salmonella enterica subsp. enterica serovar Menston]